MSRLATFVASSLVVAVTAPALSLAAGDNELRSAPQMFRVDADTVQLKFATDKPVRKGDIRIAVAGAGTGRTVKAAGRHGEDFRYTARVDVDRELEIGTKYTVRFTFGDGDPQAVKVLMRAAR